MFVQFRKFWEKKKIFRSTWHEPSQDAQENLAINQIRDKQFVILNKTIMWLSFVYSCCVDTKINNKRLKFRKHITDTSTAAGNERAHSCLRAEGGI